MLLKPGTMAPVVRIMVSAPLSSGALVLLLLLLARAGAAGGAVVVSIGGTVREGVIVDEEVAEISAVVLVVCVPEAVWVSEVKNEPGETSGGEGGEDGGEAAGGGLTPPVAAGFTVTPSGMASDAGIEEKPGTKFGATVVKTGATLVSERA